MTEHVILCGGATASAAGKCLSFNLAGPRRNFRLELEQLSLAAGADIPPRLVDLLEIAAYVFAADESLSRGGSRRRNWGADWRRSMRFCIPVRESAFWQREDVGSALAEALSFLSEDSYSFEFIRATAPNPIQSYLFAPPEPGTIYAPDEIVLFSGGLDSLAGAMETLATTDRRVALVSHRSAPKVLSYQRDLASALMQRFPGRVFPIRVYATRVASERDAKEDTQRSRTFLYTVLGFVVARLFRIDRVRLCENGVVSINLPISEQIVGTMATRTTHPYALRLLAHFLSLVADQAFQLENPLLWLTKTEVLHKLKCNGGAKLVRKAVSCSHVRKMAKATPHCGRCSQCLDRRFAVLAAGMEDDDPKDMYVTDLLRGRRENDYDTTMAVEFCRHAVKLSKMTDDELNTAFAGEIGRVRDAFPDCDADTIGEQCFRLFSSHGADVASVLTAAVDECDSALARHDLPSSCLLRLHLAGNFEQQPISAPTPEPYSIEPEAEDSEAAPRIFPLQLAIDEPHKLAEVVNLVTFAGKAFELLRALAARHREDVAAGLRLEHCRYSSADDLADELLIDVEYVRQIVSREIRRDLKEALLELGESPATDLLVETGPSRQGYRLNPLVRLVAASGA